MTRSKNDIAWAKIFDKYQILEGIVNDGHVNITATRINEFREARLMTKFDHKSQLPKLFAENNLSILPTSRGGYVIGKFDTFETFDNDDTEASPIDFPTFLESLDYREISSEATAINCSFVSKILHDFTKEDILLPTVSGRMGSSIFNFSINSFNGAFNVKVENAQVEIDGGFEGDRSLCLIEAKNYLSDDFLVRQLFYPYKLWSNKIHKQVRPIFLTYSNGVFHLREYKFTDSGNYNSITLLNQRKYIFREAGFNIETLSRIINSVIPEAEPKIPFPQADSFERIINLCELLNQRDFISKEEITQNYDFDARQTDYYSNAGKYLGLIDIRNDSSVGQIGCQLTTKGKQTFSLNIIERQKEFVKIIISHSVFYEVLKQYLLNGEIPEKDFVVEIMKKAKLHNVEAESTYFRRASTIIGWINWIVAQIEE